VFVPGWSLPASIWAKQIAALSDTHKVVALDPRGQGESEIPAQGYTTERRAEDLHDLVSRYRPVVLVTWSLGSLEALQYVHRRGEASLRALVIVDSSIGEIPAVVRAPGSSPPAPAPAARLSFQDELRLDRTKATEAFLRAIFRTPQPDGAIAALREAALRMPLEASLSLFPGDRIPRERWRMTANAFRRPCFTW
jgi:microsomal epoxide hydrolase